MMFLTIVFVSFNSNAGFFSKDLYNIEMVTTNLGTFLEKKEGYEYESLEECNKAAKRWMRVKHNFGEVNGLQDTLISATCVKESKFCLICK